MKKLLFITAIIFACTSVMANNIQITNVSVVPANNTIKFDVSWENSWRSNTLNNWDAAWVFFKYKDVDGLWKHVYLTNTGNVTPSGFTITNAVEPAGPLGAIGAFIYRASAGSGTNTINNMEIGIPAIYASGVYDIKAFGIEMVYIPQAPFFPGDGVSTNSYNINYPITSTTTFVYDSIPPTIFFNSTTYPNGFKAFYCMKYELSQGGYRDFLNTLNYDNNPGTNIQLRGQILHTAVAPTAAPGTHALYNGERNHIKIKTSAINPNTPAVYGCDANNNGIYDELADGENVACNFLLWVDHARYMAWAGLRPLTELEFEKAARGIQLPVAGEYVWGNTNIFAGPPYYTNINSNLPSEAVSNASVSPIGNAQYNLSYAVFGPIRNGVFATATSNRISSGASFYGVMELSGNLFERVITTATPVGRNYTGNHGIGQYPSASLNGWPGYDAALNVINTTNSVTGLIYRGGSWFSLPNALRTSDRAGILFFPGNLDIGRSTEVGIRGCRTAPL